MKRVIITIDTEGHEGVDPISGLIWGKTDQGSFGIDRIMDICSTYNAKGLFFVDIAEAWDYGKDEIAKVIKHILYRGHDVGVHIHPDHMADKNRLFLWEYTKEEQYSIIKKCTDLYVEIAGRHPEAFRAGKYGANRDTLDILSELGYKYDFSQFFGQKWCGINPPVAISLPHKYKDIYVVPVTVFRSFKIGSFKRYDKIDAVMNSSEYKNIMDCIAIDERNIIVSLFYHSFSMLDWREDPNNPKYNAKEEKKFIDSLKYVHESNDFKFVSLSFLGRLLESSVNKNDVDLEEDIISTNGFLRTFYYTLKRAYSIRKINRKARMIIIMAYISVGLITLLSYQLIISIFVCK